MDESQALPAVPTIRFDDAHLARQAQHGDAAAFAQLVAKYQDRIFNVCLRFCGHAEDARDLTQETFLRAFASVGAFKHRSSFYTWLFRIAMNVAISHQRQLRRTVHLPFDAVDQLPATHQARHLARQLGNPTSPADHLTRTETEQIVTQALLQLDEPHRAVVVLRDIEGLDYHQIAQILQVAVGTVKSRLHRARVSLRQQLAPLLESP